MAKINVTLDELLDDLADRIAARLGDVNGTGDTGPAAKASKPKGRAKASTKAVEEDEAVDEDDDAEEEDDSPLADRIAELMKKNVRTLRKDAIALGFEEDEVSEATKDDLAKGIAEAEAEDAESDEDAEDDDEDEAESSDEDSEEDEDDEEEAEADEPDYSRADLKKKTLVALKKIAKDEYEIAAADLKGLDKEGVIDLILDEGEDEEAEEDEEEPYSEEDLREMSLAELKALCKEYEIKVPRGAKEDDLIDLLMESDEEDEDD